MKDRRDEKIERIERRILKANRVSAEELREIVSAPLLFDKINARIKLAQETEKAPQRRFPVWGWRRIGFAFGAFAVFLATALGLVFLKADFSVPQLTASVGAPEIERQTVFVEEPEIIESGTTENAARETSRIVSKNKLSKTVRRVPNMNSSRKAVRPEREEPEEAFYPLAFADSLEEAKEAGQVIRVELSRSSLLALGVNPPSEDENLKVKTDLLIGSDGVARGIRFVK